MNNDNIVISNHVDSSNNKVINMISLGLQMFGALMGIVIVILNLMNLLDMRGAMSLLGVDIFCINISLMIKK